jgi:hypothetical protein
MWGLASARRCFNGHFKPTEADKINRIGQLRQGVVKVIENPNSLRCFKKYTIADMITGLVLQRQFVISTLYMVEM